MKQRMSAGFTLVEVMVTVAILAILVLVAMPSFQGTIDARKLKSQTEAIADMVRLARTEAMKRAAAGTPKTVTVSVIAGWSIGLTNSEAGCTDAATCVLVQGANNAVPYLLASSNDAQCKDCTVATVTDANFSFSFRGVVSSGTAQGITVTSPKGVALRVAVSPVGRVNVCGPTGATLGYPACG